MTPLKTMVPMKMGSESAFMMGLCSLAQDYGQDVFSSMEQFQAGITMVAHSDTDGDRLPSQAIIAKEEDTVVGSRL